jgi:hypothetical protein
MLLVVTGFYDDGENSAAIGSVVGTAVGLTD